VVTLARLSAVAPLTTVLVAVLFGPTRCAVARKRICGDRSSPAKVRTMTDTRASSGPELDQLTSYLDAQRAVLLLKAEGLTSAQLAQRHPPSTLTLGALLNHGALNEDHWFAVQFKGLPEAEPVDQRRLGQRR
jgi:hypothetical protein